MRELFKGQTYRGLTPKGFKGVRPLLVLLLLLSGIAPLRAEEEHPVLLLEVSGTIDPAIARYVTRGLEQARRRQAGAVVLQLNTSGGLDGPMRKIIQGILNSPVPVVVYVAPQGARSAGGGVFVTLAAHVVAMSPGTRLGEVSSVPLGEGMDEKLRGREIDFIAVDLEDLLRQADGRIVKTVFGVSTLSLRERPRVRVPLSVLEKFLHGLARSQRAYLLLLLGISGLIYELARPGAIFPGVVGALLLILALAALEMLGVNWGRMVLIALTVLFFLGIGRLGLRALKR